MLKYDLTDLSVHTVLQNETSLRTLKAQNSAALGNVDFSKLLNLTVLEYDCSWICNTLEPFLPVAGVLKEMDLVNTVVTNASRLGDFSALEKVFFLFDDSRTAADLPIPMKLKELKLTIVASAPMTTLAIYDINPACVLESITIGASLLENITAIPTSVKSIAISSDLFQGFDCPLPPSLVDMTLWSGRNWDDYHLDPSMGELDNLTSLDFQGGSPNGWVRSLPSLEFTNLTSLRVSSFSSTIINSDLMETVLCTLLPKTKVTSLILDSLRLSSLPSCLSDYINLEAFSISAFDVTPNNGTGWENNLLPLLPSSLRSLTVRDTIYPYPRAPWHLDWSALVRKFPNLVALDLAENVFAGTFPVELQLLTQLQYLDVSSNALNGTIPHGFFANLPNLSVLYASGNLLSGTLPWYGLQSLTLLEVSFNLFTAWPSIVGSAPKMEFINCWHNDLRQIPDDQSFLNMPVLGSIDFGLNPNLNGPVPAFWATHPTLFSFKANGCNLTGPLPSTLRSPSLSVLVLADNQLCGPLPRVLEPYGMSNIQFSANLLSGPIPPSWRNLTLVSYLDLSENLLDGTLPNPFMSTLTRKLNVLSVSNNYFTGGFPSFANFSHLLSISAKNTDLDYCAQSPAFPSGIVGKLSCDVLGLESNSVGVCACESYWLACYELSCSSTVDPPAVTAPIALPPVGPAICVAPSPRPGPPPVPSGCPLPAPQGPFVCANGIWQSVGSVEVPTVTIQPGSIVEIRGNLTVSDSITISGASSQVIVQGCFVIGPGGSITVQVTQEEIEQMIKTGNSTKTTQKTFLQSSCGTDLQTVTVTTEIASNPKSCNKVTSENASTNGALIVVFTLQAAKCASNNHLVAIVVPSVVGAVLILTAVGAILIYHYRHRLFSKSVPHS